MIDIVKPAKRSAMMANVKAKDTKPEMIVRSLAHQLGYRFRLHKRDLPGSPDLTFPKLKKTIFVHGCFWHRHEGCKFSYSPKSNQDFWQKKFASNVKRDNNALIKLAELGWEALIIWECETKDLAKLRSILQKFLSQSN